MNTSAIWRAATPSDLSALSMMADRIHPSFPEGPQVFAERLRLYPAGARILDSDGTALGYVISHPWLLGSIPALNALLGELPAAADTFYIHDLALLPAARGTGAAARAIAAIADHARAEGFATLSLVAVNGSIPFWSRHGFLMREVPALADKLKSYEPHARLMVASL